MKYSPSVSQAQQPGKREDMIRSGKPTTEERVNKIDMQCNVNECKRRGEREEKRRVVILTLLTCKILVSIYAPLSPPKS